MPVRDVMEHQAFITALLLHYTRASLNSVYVRGVAPAPGCSASVRVVVGPCDGTVRGTGPLIAYSFPLVAENWYLSGHDIAKLLRTLSAAGSGPPNSEVGDMMGIPLIHIDPMTTTLSDHPPADNAQTILLTLAKNYGIEPRDPLLLGFLFLAPDRLRLYLAPSDLDEVIGADLNPEKVAVTATIASLPSLITDALDDSPTVSNDPHCSYLVDLTHW